MDRFNITAKTPSMAYHRPDERFIDVDLGEELRGDLAVSVGIEGIIDVVKKSDQRPVGLIISIMPSEAFHRRFHAIGVVEMSLIGGVFFQKSKRFTSGDHGVLLLAKYSRI